MKRLSQTTSETCLPISLIYLLLKMKKKVKRSEELNILIKGIKFTKLDYSIGQLVYVAKKYKVRIKFYVEFKKFFEKLNKFRLPKNLELLNKKIDLNLLKELIKDGPLIVYVDDFYIRRVIHYPHFVVLLDINESVKFFDPWDGKIKKIDKKRFIKGIQSLRNKLKFSPKVIQIFPS